MVVEREIVTCPHCGKAHLIEFDGDEIDNLVKWSERQMLIQDALPNRNAYERELIRYAWSGLPMLKCSEDCVGIGF